MTAFTFSVTLSRVMMSCGGTSSASCRNETRTMRSMRRKNQNHARPFRRSQQPPQAKDHAAFILGQYLDRAEEVEDNDDDNDAGERQTHPKPPRLNLRNASVADCTATLPKDTASPRGWGCLARCQRSAQALWVAGAGCAAGEGATRNCNPSTPRTTTDCPAGTPLADMASQSSP